jgi:hypothetical protein
VPGLPNFGLKSRLLRWGTLAKLTGVTVTDTPDTHSKESAPPLSDVPHAPFIFFEGTPGFGTLNGVINITLTTHRTLAGPDGHVTTDQVVVAYLRGSIPAARILRDSIDRALLLAVPTGEGKAN